VESQLILSDKLVLITNGADEAEGARVLRLLVLDERGQPDHLDLGGRCYDYNFLRFSAKKIVFLINQCYDKNFLGFSLKKLAFFSKANVMTKIFCDFHLKNWRFSHKTNFMITIFYDFRLILAKNWRFSQKTML
jgi:hypothetical protein